MLSILVTADSILAAAGVDLLIVQSRWLCTTQDIILSLFCSR